MFCLKCGEAIPDGSTVCPQCGAELAADNDNQTVVYASQREPSISTMPKPTKRLPKKLLYCIIAVVCIVIAVFAVNEVTKANLKKTLIKEWYDVNDSIIKVLDVGEDNMEYRLETGYSWMDTSLGNYEWKPISGNKIKIKRFNDKYETYTIEFNDDKDVLTISPAITSADSSETWYHIDQ